MVSRSSLNEKQLFFFSEFDALLGMRNFDPCWLRDVGPPRYPTESHARAKPICYRPPSITRSAGDRSVACFYSHHRDAGNTFFYKHKFMCSRLQEAAICCREKYHGTKKEGKKKKIMGGKIMMAPRSYCQVRSRRVHFEAAT